MRGFKTKETYLLFDKNGNQFTVLWTSRKGLKDCILDNLTARQFFNFEYATILNKGGDNTKHRPIKKTDLF